MILEEEITVLAYERDLLNIQQQIFIYVDKINRLRLESKELEEQINAINSSSSSIVRSGITDSKSTDSEH